MSFNKAAEMVRSVVQKHSKISDAATKKVGLSKIAAFHTINEVLYRFERALRYMAEIEKQENISETGKICNSWNYVKGDSFRIVSRLKPFLSITYEEGGERIAFLSSHLGVSITPSQLGILFNGKEFRFPLVLDEEERNAYLIKALSSKLMIFADSLMTRIEQCAKFTYGIRI